ncbi:hypothetical protein WA158_001768 [Blastocystis sp. Blastoise]
MDKEVETMLVHLDWIKKDLQLDIPEGKTKEEHENGFELLQSKLFNEIAEMKADIDARNALLDRGANRRKIIECNSQINRKMKQITVDFEALKERFMKDDKKRIGKMTPEEKKERLEVIQNLQSQIKTIGEKYEEEEKNMSVPTDELCSFTDTSSFAIDKNALNKTSNTNQSNHKALVGGDIEQNINAYSGGPELTDAQQQNMVQIERNQQEFDQLLEIMANGLNDLEDMAHNINDEITKQSKMLDSLETNMDTAQEHLDKTQKKLGKTLHSSKRSGDKFCMDLVLILIIVFIGVVIVNILL